MRAHENPFRSEQVEALAFRPQNDAWPAIMARLAAMHYRGGVVGPKGSGKTTMLAELKTRLEADGWRVESRRLNEKDRRISEMRIDAKTIILLDGAEQLNWLRWKLFQWRVRGAGGLIVTTHRPGRMRPIHAARTSPELMRELLAELTPHADQGLAEGLFHAQRGNLRDVFFNLYLRSA